MAKVAAKRAKSSTQSEQGQPAVTTPFAFTPDGQVFINAAECNDRDIEGRAQFIGVLMSRKEARFARKVVNDAVAGAASKIAARMPMKSTTANAHTTATKIPRPKSSKNRGTPSTPSGSGAVAPQTR